MDANKRKEELRRKRHMRIRARLSGTLERPRLCVFRSGKHIYAQVVDDQEGRTLLSASTCEKQWRERGAKGGTVASAAELGALVGRRCLEKGIMQVVFDRGGFKFHGRVKALAEAARKQFADAGAKGF